MTKWKTYRNGSLKKGFIHRKILRGSTSPVHLSSHHSPKQAQEFRCYRLAAWSPIVSNFHRRDLVFVLLGFQSNLLLLPPASTSFKTFWSRPQAYTSLILPLPILDLSLPWKNRKQTKSKLLSLSRSPLLCSLPSRNIKQKRLSRIRNSRMMPRKTKTAV